LEKIFSEVQTQKKKKKKKKKFIMTRNNPLQGKEWLVLKERKGVLWGESGEKNVKML